MSPRSIVVHDHTMEIEGPVVSPLTIKAILRFDVLKEHDTAIDVKSKEILFYTCSCTFPLTEANTPCRTQPTVHIIATIATIIFHSTARLR